MFKPSVLVLALVLSGSTLWSAIMDGSMSVTTALVRFLIAVPVAAGMLHVLRSLTASYHQRPATADQQPAAGEPDRLGQPIG